MRPRDTYAEPYKIKMVEPIRLISPGERKQAITEAGYNVFNLKSEDVYIDLLTDSGTSAMSEYQWAGIMSGDESYAGSKNFYHLQQVIEDITGCKFVVPTHQGRAAEHILMRVLVKPGDRIPGNMHFDTTEGHIRLSGAEPVNCLTDQGYIPGEKLPFKGNIDINKLEKELLAHGREKIPFILITATCNNNGGQPVSLENFKAVRRLADRFGVPVFLDAARFAENAYFIQQREPGYRNKTLKEIVGEMFSCADGCTMSAKKDALVNIGGFLALKSEELYQQAVEWQIPFEGFRTYGGLAGRDIEAMARGLEEVLDEQYLENRIGQVQCLGEKLIGAGIPIVQPPGGHGIYIDAGSLLGHLPHSQFPAQALVVELYLEGGIRSVELGACAFGHRDGTTGEMIYPALELVRLTIPRRVYTDRHMDFVARAAEAVADRKNSIRGLQLVYEAPVLRHFTARFARL
ncbi:MAG: tryptophanase [Peptococcaceae bacterium BICA1-7]|nr:MAG: tryptophanase [Peptococcaceae bacterium BICA1-7]HBV98596.1 tyrosine phenol-lyase [Desulfotomaculum sp.]